MKILPGTMTLMVLKTLERTGPQHGYGIARIIERTSDTTLSLNYGTIHPVLSKLEKEGSITSEWGLSEANRRARFYRLTTTGHKRLRKETEEWKHLASIIARFTSSPQCSGRFGREIECESERSKVTQL